MLPRSTDRGQATVEVALVLPVLVTIVLGVAQVGVVSRRSVEVTHAARAAAREAVVSPDLEAVSGAAIGATRLDPARMSVQLEGDASAGGLLRVTVSYTDPTDLPLVGRLIGAVTLREELSVRVE